MDKIEAAEHKHMTKQKETHFSTSLAWRISSKGQQHKGRFNSDTCSQRHHLRRKKMHTGT